MGTAAGFRHDAFIHDADDAFVERIAPFLRGAVEQEAPAIIVTTESKWTGLREALGDHAAGVEFSDSGDVYANPAATMAHWDRTLSYLARPASSPARVVGELDFGDDEANWNRWMVYDSLINCGLDDHNVMVICSYDTRTVPEPVVAQAAHTHGDTVVAPELYVAGLLPKPAPLRDLRDLGAPRDVAAARERVAGALELAGVSAVRARDLLHALDEVVANALRHGERVESIRTGVVDGRFVCEVTDAGPGLDGSLALAGRLPPRPGVPGRGGGLWLVRQLVDEVELFRAAWSGLTVRLWL